MFEEAVVGKAQAVSWATDGSISKK